MREIVCAQTWFVLKFECVCEGENYNEYPPSSAKDHREFNNTAPRKYAFLKHFFFATNKNFFILEQVN